VASLWPLSGSRLVLILHLGKIGVPVLVLSNSSNIFLWSFSETQKQQKTGNWHYDILLVGYFQKSHKNATKCNETQGKWCKNKHGASKIIDMFEMYHAFYLMERHH
jgi:hypothetical protein